MWNSVKNYLKSIDVGSDFFPLTCFLMKKSEDQELDKKEVRERERVYNKNKNSPGSTNQSHNAVKQYLAETDPAPK